MIPKLRPKKSFFMQFGLTNSHNFKKSGKKDFKALSAQRNYTLAHFIMKRTRAEDGSSSVEGYDADFRNAPSSRGGGTSDPNNAAPDRKTCYVKQIQAINTAVCDWVAKQVGNKITKEADLSHGVQDAIDSINFIASRYLSPSGSIMSFGSGDCGQAGHGMEEDADLMVPYPRPVASLSQQAVVFVACGGLHNAIVTQVRYHTQTYAYP